MIFLDGQADSSDHKKIIEERIVEKERRLQVEARGDIEIKQTRETEMQQRDREDTRTNGDAVRSFCYIFSSSIFITMFNDFSFC